MGNGVNPHGFSTCFEALLRWRHDDVARPEWDGQLDVGVDNVTAADAGLYECYVEGERSKQLHGLVHLSAHLDANYPETASQPGEEAETAVSDDEGDVIGEYVTEVEENPEMTIINSRDRTIMMPTGALSVSGHHPEMAPEDGSSTDGGAAWKLSGCVDGAGRMYEIGERMTISGDPCEMCRCHDNGKPLCAMASCAGPPSRYCRAIYTADNTCCPEWDCSAPTLTPSGDYDVVNIVGDGTGIEEELHEYVEPLSLGCVFKGFLFQNGESFRRGCDACYCRDGRAECVAVKCNAPKPGYECIIVNRGKPKSCCPQYRCKKTRGPKKVGEESRLAALWANWKQQQLEQQGLRRGRRQ
ncbi:PREDICTED: uncharacterized protein LOC106817222 [Priapulus caudatus]|uniref:Uncharacterized protein LOC106817222 n=1 Tax=Priapulus caudatus TaxID=37621 RepID=A0ABM1EYV1_PRICU|nr:PREDICTED: uncharacterized protein LOC106817222 [Priapulus caudatus]